jgi:hypothetical protein
MVVVGPLRDLSLCLVRVGRLLSGTLGVTVTMVSSLSI